MINRIYYGECSLKYWIDLMLSGNVVLPEYQRSFVWKERDMRHLIKSLPEDQFVQSTALAFYASFLTLNLRNIVFNRAKRS